MHRAGGRNGQPSPLAIREVATERRLRQKIKNFFTVLLVPGAFPGEMRERRPARLIYSDSQYHITGGKSQSISAVPALPSVPGNIIGL